jgi:hypothetical protein
MVNILAMRSEYLHPSSIFHKSMAPMLRLQNLKARTDSSPVSRRKKTMLFRNFSLEAFSALHSKITYHFHMERVLEPTMKLTNHHERVMRQILSVRELGSRLRFGDEMVKHWLFLCFC